MFWVRPSGVDGRWKAQLGGYLVPYAELTAAHVSSVTLVTVGLERYIAVCRPLQAGSTCTRKRAAYLCLGAWALSSATARVMVLNMGSSDLDLTGIISSKSAFSPAFH
ncbi:hypothetical protein QYM36_016538 [Artemia franciscana]|uniref:G-protein coupled receptors family 1 profile domain-containing protein n=1 Tax=Artemia franciscana TaxID=6661 RepID=A0AA88HKI4_ARTSF|nr:hypothetical protein QYM36_016538 [Artemia franciscana]